MLNDILLWAFIFVGTFNLIHFGLYLVAANIYDIDQNFRDKKRKKALSTKSSLKETQPLVSVLIPAFNESKVIQKSLESVYKNTYKNIEIIVINDGSKDNTKEIVREFIAHNSVKDVTPTTKIIRNMSGTFERIWFRDGEKPNPRLVLIHQKNTGKANALNNALTSDQIHGDLVMTLDGDSILAKNAIENAVKYFDSPEIAGVAANVRIAEEQTALGLLQRFEHLISYRSKKFYSLTNSELIVGGVASTYRYKTLREAGNYDDDTVTEDIGLSMKVVSAGNKSNRLVYGADVVAYTEGVGDFKTLLRQRYRWKLGNMQNIIKFRSMLFSSDKKYTKSLSYYRMPMAFFGEILLLLEPLVLLYAIYLSYQYLTIGLFLGAYMTITLYLFLTIWPDEHYSKRDKIKATIQAPVVYFIFYIMNVVQLVSLVRCLINYKKITGKTKTESTWISPSRRGLVTNSI